MHCKYGGLSGWEIRTAHKPVIGNRVEKKEVEVEEGS
jgi:hypothetical protein